VRTPSEQCCDALDAYDRLQEAAAEGAKPGKLEQEELVAENARLEAEISWRREARAVDKTTIENLALLAKRLARATLRVDPYNKLAVCMVCYLERKGLCGQPLREATQSAPL
jgi:hypothetical protein